MSGKARVVAQERQNEVAGRAIPVRHPRRLRLFRRVAVAVWLLLLSILAAAVSQATHAGSIVLPIAMALSALTAVGCSLVKEMP